MTEEERGEKEELEILEHIKLIKRFSSVFLTFILFSADQIESFFYQQYLEKELKSYSRFRRKRDIENVFGLMKLNMPMDAKICLKS